VRYPGGKNGAGVFQTIINQIPEHSIYIEAFVGSGAVLRNKRPATSTIVIDADADVAARWFDVAEFWSKGSSDSLIALHGDARSLIGIFADRGLLSPRVFIYCDPPYVRSSRRSAAAIYRHEMTDADHLLLLGLLVQLPALVMVSGYRCPLYDVALSSWRRIDFQAMTRGGPSVESLWMNYPEPVALADYSHLGRNFRERQDLKRQRERWQARLARMSPLKRQALIEAVADIASAGSPLPAGAGPLGKSADASWPGSSSADLPLLERHCRESVSSSFSGGSAPVSVLHAKSTAQPRR